MKRYMSMGGPWKTPLMVGGLALSAITACGMKNQADSSPHATTDMGKIANDKATHDAIVTRKNCRADKDGVLVICKTDFADLSNEMQYNTPFYGAIYGVVQRDDSGFRLMDSDAGRPNPRSLRISQNACARMTPPDDCAGMVGREVTAFGLIHTVHAADQRNPKDGMELAIFMTQFMNGREADANIESAESKSQR
jgi:hypothetical protein